MSVKVKVETHQDFRGKLVAGANWAIKLRTSSWLRIEHLRLWGPKGAHPALNNASRQLAANYRTEQSTTTYTLIMGYAIRLLQVQFEPAELAKPVKLPSRFDTLNGFDSEQLDVCFTFLPHMAVCKSLS